MLVVSAFFTLTAAAWSVDGFVGVHRQQSSFAALQSTATATETTKPRFSFLKRKQSPAEVVEEAVAKSPRPRYVRSALGSMKVGGYVTDLLAFSSAAVVVAGLDLMGFVKLKLSALPLTLTAPFLGMLLAFRTKSSLGRWMEGRSIWTGLVKDITDLNRKATAIREWESGRYKFSALGVAFAFVLKVHLREMAVGRSDEEREELRIQLEELVGRAEAEAILRAGHRPHAVANAMTRLLEQANLEPSLQARVDKGISKLLDYVGLCERLVKTPIPVVSTKLTERAVCAWLLFLPSALLGVGLGFAHTVLGTAISAAGLLAVDNLSVQIEEPFSVLPLNQICDNLRGDYDRILMNTVYSNQQPKPSTSSSVPYLEYA